MHFGVDPSKRRWILPEGPRQDSRIIFAIFPSYLPSEDNAITVHSVSLFLGCVKFTLFHCHPCITSARISPTTAQRTRGRNSSSSSNSIRSGWCSHWLISSRDQRRVPKAPMIILCPAKRPLQSMAICADVTTRSLVKAVRGQESDPPR